MKQTAKACILFSIGFLLISAAYTENSEAKEANLVFRGEYLSADLNDTSVDAIFRTLEKEKGIWCTGNQSLLDKKVTVRFTNHSLVDGMKRILASMNYCLVFESDGRLAGAVLIGKEKHGTASIIASRGAREKTLPSRMKEENVTPRMAFETAAVNNNPRMGISPNSSKSDSKNFNILTNSQSQNAPLQMKPEQQRESLKVLRDFSSHSVPPQMTPEQQRESLKVLRDFSPSENPNEHLIDTRIIKNHPPPGK